MKIIDLNQLERLWVEHPERYRKAAEEVADTRKEVEEGEARLDIISAELERDIRVDPESYGIEKITESIVKSTILLQKPYRTGQQDVIDKRHKLAYKNAALQEVDREKYALQNEVQLWIATYFSTPYVDNNKYMEKTEKDKMNKAFGNKRRREE